MLAAASEVAQLWALSSPDPFFRLEVPPKTVNDVCFSADARSLYVATNSEILARLDLYTGKRSTLETDSSTITKVSCSSNDAYTATGSRAGVLTVFSNLQPQDRPEVFRSHRIQITSLLFTNDSTTLIAGDRYGQISIGSFKRTRLPDWSARRGQIYDISAAKHSDIIGISSESGFALYDLIDSKVISSKSIKSHNICYSSFNDNLIAIATTESELLFYDPSADAMIAELPFSGPITALDFKFDGVTIAAAVNEHGIKVVDIRRLDQSLNLRLDPGQSVHSIKFQPKFIDDPISADFIQGKPPQIHPNPKTVQIQKPPDPVPEPEPEIDLDTIRSTLYQIEQDVKLNEPTLSPRNASLLKTARSIAKPMATVHSALSTGEILLTKKPPKEIKPEEAPKLSSEAQEISQIVTSYFRNAMNEVEDELAEAFNTLHLDVLTRIAALHREIDDISLSK
jgi:hypothetical protein